MSSSAQSLTRWVGIAAWGVAAVVSVDGARTSSKRVLLLTHNTFYNHSNLEAIEHVLP